MSMEAIERQTRTLEQAERDLEWERIHNAQLTEVIAKLQKDRNNYKNQLEELVGMIYDRSDEIEADTTDASAIRDHIQALVDRGYSVIAPGTGEFMSRRGKSLTSELESLKIKLRSAEDTIRAMSGIPI